MSWFNIRILAYAVFLNYAMTLYAQHETVKFEHLSLQQGLSQTTISTMLQDEQGFMWFGTSDGLNKYDGYNFTVYRNQPADTTSLSDDWTTTIYESRHNGTATLWFGTARGQLNKYDREKDRFIHYRLPRHDLKTIETFGVLPAAPYMFSFFVDSTITAIAEDFDGHNNVLWIGTWGYGLYRLNEADQEITHYQYNPADPHSLSNNRIYALCRDASGVLWVGTFGGGINKLNKETLTFTRYQHDPGTSNSLTNDYIWSIVEDRSGALWVGTFGGGLDKIIPHASGAPSSGPSVSGGRREETDFDGVLFIHFQNDASDPHSLSDNHVTDILEDRYGTLWVGTFGGGLNKFSRDTQKFTCFRHDPYNPYSLGDDDVLSLCEDESGILWIGAHLGGGISKFDRQKQKFTHLKNDPANANSLSDDIIWSICETAEKRESILWVGSYRGGLNRFDRKRNRIVHYQHDPTDPNSLSENHVRAIYEDDSGALWIGTFSEGLNQLVPSQAESVNGKTAKFIHYRHNPFDRRSLSDNRIRAICGDNSDALWIATFGGGLNKLEKNGKKFIHYRHDPANSQSLSDDRAYCVYRDRSGALWIGTFGGGLNRLVSSATNSVLETRVTFAGVGLNAGNSESTGRLTRRNEARFIHYRHDPTNSNSLSSDRILSIYEDKAGMLWVGTDGGGLNKFDRRSGTFEHFTEDDGLPSDLVFGILEDDNGNLWLSTNNGLSKFNPQQRVFKNYDEYDGLQSQEFSGGAYYKSPRGEMFFGGVNGLNSFFPERIAANAHIPPIVITTFKVYDEEMKIENGRIELSHRDDFFSFEFAALDYANPAKNQYAYMLEGFDKNWIYCGARRFASYTNLNPGEYLFRVKGANSDGVWNEAGISLRIKISPPFWRTWWFLGLSAAMLVGAALLLHNARVKLKIRNLLEMERIRKEENERLRKQVARDFHDELGHKLTNIFLYTEILRRNLNGASPQGLAYLTKISDASKSLSYGIRDFIWTLDPKKDSLYDVILRLKDFGDELFSSAGINFHVKGAAHEFEQVTLSIDWRRQITLIFKEAMNNILKHAKCKNVVLEIAVHQQKAEIRLSDDGIGMIEGTPTFGLGLSNMKKRAEKISGALDIISNDAAGTTIWFRGEIPPMGD